MNISSLNPRKFVDRQVALNLVAGDTMTLNYTEGGVAKTITIEVDVPFTGALRIQGQI
jgi:hypothetical protein